MATKISIAELVQRSRPKLQSVFVKEDDFSEVQPSPELVDLLIWNVAVSFVVSIVSNAAYDGLVYCLKSKGRVEPPDLSKLKGELNTQVVVSSFDLNTAERRIATLLQTQYLYAEKDANEKAAATVKAIASQVQTDA